LSRLARLALILLLVVGPATAAFAKSFWLSNADIEVVVNGDGSLSVTEILRFDFSGDFSGAYRDIPLEPGQQVTSISVSDETVFYTTGGCTELGCTSPAGTFGVAEFNDLVRIVWHHDSLDETRDFTISYVMTGLTTVYDDVVDVNLKVWGDQSAVGLDRLDATVDLPGAPIAGEVYVWGHPFGVDGITSLGDDEVSPSLQASNIPAEQWVEIRVVFPREELSATNGATVVPGDGLPTILAEEEAFNENAEQAARAGRTGLIWGSVFALLTAIGLGGFVYFRYGREPRVDYDRQYEQEPPSDLTPAEVGALISQGSVTEKEFTATMFDLIRRGVIGASPTQVERSTWGGLRTETITDLVLSVPEKESQLRNFEQSLINVVGRVLELGPRPLHEFREAIRDDAAANAKSYQDFRDQALGGVRRSGLLDDAGHGVAWAVRLVMAAAVIGSFFLLPRLLAKVPGGDVIAVLISIGLVVGTIMLFILLSFRRIRNRRSKEGALESARWEAFRRYLSDFSRLEEAPPISLELWDRFLVYAIVFGVAAEVLAQARLHAPPELETASSIYWFGSYGYSGGHSENAFAGIQSALSGAFTPPSSSGGGGGFSGGGGGGGGGGGAGAW
jgi:uncharacterized membrane protein